MTERLMKQLKQESKDRLLDALRDFEKIIDSKDFIIKDLEAEARVLAQFVHNSMGKCPPKKDKAVCVGAATVDYDGCVDCWRSYAQDIVEERKNALRSIQ